MSKNLGTIDRSVLPKYSLSKNTIKETNIKPIKLGKQQNKIEDAIEQYVRFVAAGPKKDVKKIKQPNLTKAVKLVKKQDDKALKKLIKSRIPDIRQGQFFANPFFSPGILKEGFKAIPTPAGTLALTAGFGVDPTSAVDRATLATEAALAPQLVKQVSKITSNPIYQRFLNLGASPKTALRIARGLSPVGIASLGAEGAYQLGKFTKKRINELRAMSPEERAELRRKGDEFAFSEFAAAGGGIAKLAGVPSGPPPKSGPTPHGLPGILKRAMKIKE